MRGIEKVPFRDLNREQAWLLPPSLDELLPLGRIDNSAKLERGAWGIREG